ncbi:MULTISPECIES: hypothetical protein [unclassified Halomonas]|uniref:hypothetical protein n=1 Tax=unclassified Halomonas TaxID=2609666 RepID=UPI004034E376
MREFEWQDHMLIAHRVLGGMEAHYSWDRRAPDGRMVGQQEAGGLARRYTYHVDHTQVTDSLGREERYHFVGSGSEQSQPLVIERGYTNLGQLTTLPCAVPTAPPANSSTNTTPWGA